MNPIAFQIGPIAVHWYGILIVVGILAAAYLGTFLARLWGEDPELVWDALVWCVFLGVVGARLYHILTVPPSMGVDRWYYFRHPAEILATWKGGLGIYGAVAGGTLGLYIAVRRAKRELWRWMDIILPGVALAQAIGRWGNYINQELYGRPTNVPWAIHIEPQYRVPGFEMYERFHPLFFYESVLDLVICVVLVYLTWRYRKTLASGVIACLYLIAYPAVRFGLDFIRVDNPSVGQITIAQIVAVCAIVAFAAVLVWRMKRRPAVPEPAPVPEPEPAPEPESGLEPEPDTGPEEEPELEPEVEEEGAETA